MDPEVYEQTKSQDLAAAMDAYASVKEGYMRMIREALQKKNPQDRAEALRSIEQENQRMSVAVERLLDIWTQGTGDMSTYKSYKIGDLRKDLETYKHQLEELKSYRDELTKLRELKKSLEYDNTSSQIIYYGLIVVALGLLLFVFVMFVSRTYFSSSSSSSSTSLFAPAPEPSMFSGIGLD
jgi:hypothetical protein